MKIIVCVKQVPDTTDVKLDPVTGTLIRDGIPSIINPDDKAAIEAALRIKDNNPETIVTILSMGPPQADVALREALAMGADEAVLLTDRQFGGSDTWATSSIIAAAIKKMDYDLIIAGRQAIDGDTAQVGPQIAEHLGIPQVSYVSGVEFEDGKLIVNRSFEDGYHRIEISCPCLITVLAELNEPRYMTVGRVFDAYRTLQVKRWGYEDIKGSISLSNMGLKGSPTKVKKSFTKPVKGHGEIHEVSADEAVDVIMRKLREKNIIR
ncbi:MAG: electron transfer flavoprotein subunit beta/FixA family protein [Clostridiales bacterium]|jgi:electron transfer flavoprotein beta subunit|nr:electron transfer flavoprotein subunit beta/FixA family protein [Clostridiales bacterium]